MKAKVADIVNMMGEIAPISLAEEWDNSGLQVGHMDRPVNTIAIALDPDRKVIDYACKNSIDMLITHHPLIFSPIKSIDLATNVGSLIEKALKHKLAVFAAHTNLDNVAGGLNDVLAEKIGLKNLRVLGEPIKEELYKLVVFVPVESEQKVLNALFETKAGKIGEYSCCSFINKGRGTFKPGVSSKPYKGRKEEKNFVDEVRVETVVRKKDIHIVVDHIRKSHPYETMAYDIYPVIVQENMQGTGRIGDLEDVTPLHVFARKIKDQLGLKTLKIVGRDIEVKKVAICTGSGSGLMKSFLASGADAYVSGDLKYHDAKIAEDSGLGLIDIGHFETEHPAVEEIEKKLNRLILDRGFDINIIACDFEQNPFCII
ncbi:MAG: Nif3-like dinuclear metal center hexameric protein [Desulfobacterales bacterium]|jgi:dinuclear metal center YbgI/SA1388 family protein|nr:Nif3-like dinuclear metal center hexameric protein [Desulfobacteraceae bacterium]MBT4364492.1 Nif3-like dinuclear metal center hexameric protein [Desulfobacteraceae bacterium]MBT7085285.1 Nif3-like dinuclear metal center hexameric protein [Desulfobacterales bacterium]MBT7697782.1 Nif3-like dinuclear metal center hexameric protein [Desulfobacterales bacterium]